MSKNLPALINRLFTATLLVVVLIACQEPENQNIQNIQGIKLEHQAN